MHITFHRVFIVAVAALAAMFLPGCGSEDNTPTPPDEPVPYHLEQRGNYTIAWLHGTPYEMGHQQGELLHDAIADAMVFVENDEVLSLIPAIADGLGVIDLALSNSFQDILDECQGLVDATADVGFNMDYCLVLNFGDILMERIPSFKAEGPGCTEVITRGVASGDDRIYHARNLDWGSMDISIIHRHPVIFVRQPADGLAHVIVGFPTNISPYTGMNIAGISMCSNEIDPVDETQKSDTGRSHVQMMYEMLKSVTSLEEVKTFLESQQHMSSELIVVADGNAKTGAVFEMTAAHMHANYLEDDYVYAVNHFLSAEMDPYDLEQDVDNPDSSLMRQWRLEQLVDPDGEDTHYGSLDLNGLSTVMRDRVNPLTKVEPPYDEENIDNDAGIGTNGPMHFVLFDPEKHLFWVAAGQLPIPQQPYVCFSMQELLGYRNAIACPAPQID